MIGDDPNAYVQTSDKWWHLFNYFQFEYFYPYLPYILLIAPWIYFLIKRRNHIKDSSSFIKKIIIFSLAGLFFGYALPYLILAIWGSLAVWAQYGGTI